MIIKDGEYADIPTPTGPMRLHLFRPAAAGRYPGILLYSEIYQITGPIRRMAAFLAGQGYLVAAPEVYHEFEKLDAVLAYDAAGTDRGDELKFTKEVRSPAAGSRKIRSSPDSLVERDGFETSVPGERAYGLNVP